MNTITRVLLVHNDGTMKRIGRFDDVDHAHVSESRRRDALMYSLERVYKTQNGLDAILINDLDMRCLTRRIVEDVFAFAAAQGIPILLDPKRQREKYAGLRGAVVLPNLLEWCHLVDEVDNFAKWRKGFDRPEVLEQMAHRSFRYLGNFTCHVITCEELGAVIIAPHPRKPHVYAVYSAKPITARPTPVLHPLGCGDVLSAVIAAELDSTRPVTESILAAFHRANVAVACYREMSWHRMPDKRSVQKKLSENPPPSPEMKAEPTMGLLFLPHDKVIRVSDAKTDVPGFVSQDKACVSAIARLVSELTSRERIRAKSVILAAPSGHGKQRIITAFKENIGPAARMDVKLEKESFASWDGKNPEQYFSRLRKGAKMDRMLVIVDEAYENKSVFKSKEMLRLLEQGSEHGMAFLFIDSHFCRVHESKAINNMSSDIRSRCSIVELSAISDRPMDIKFLVADTLLGVAREKNFDSLRIENRALLAAINEVLNSGNPRRTLEKIREAFAKVCVTNKKETPRLKQSDLSGIDSAGSETATGLVPKWFDIVAR